MRCAGRVARRRRRYSAEPCVSDFQQDNQPHAEGHQQLTTPSATGLRGGRKHCWYCCSCGLLGSTPHAYNLYRGQEHQPPKLGVDRMARLLSSWLKASAHGRCCCNGALATLGTRTMLLQWCIGDPRISSLTLIPQPR